MRVLKEKTLKEAVKPMDFSVQFSKRENGIYGVSIDGHRLGLFDEDDTQAFIKLKLDFIKKFEKLVEKS